MDSTDQRMSAIYQIWNVCGINKVDDFNAAIHEKNRLLLRRSGLCVIWLANALIEKNYNCRQFEQYFTEPEKKEQLRHIEQWAAPLLLQTTYEMRGHHGFNQGEEIREIDINKLDTSNPPISEKLSDGSRETNRIVVRSIFDKIEFHSNGEGVLIKAISKDYSSSAVLAVFRNYCDNKLYLFDPLIGVLSLNTLDIARVAMMVDSLLNHKYLITKGSINWYNFTRSNPHLLMTAKEYNALGN
ncbi:hypothetical protein [Pelagibaculum spongiae]|uniref:Uncharacterized protein n=1 Tax=Pelagibaculum spongiae TaxID=2080658 RepID=A0A2V1H508_9GAMM|nr:hypothetical protein [Pelagibaculum spongiae]PVZ72318.1 hypothetical protein DC094_04740 [Pelagibaculum spongiae]